MKSDENFFNLILKNKKIIRPEVLENNMKGF